MLESRNRNFISRLLLTVSLFSLIAVLIISVIRIIKFGVKSGKYYDPYVASKVFEGTLYDRNGKILSITSPLYSEDETTYNLSKRTYPANFHSAQLIEEIEKNFSDLIAPVPGLEETFTYGMDIYLTIDYYIQYLLDLNIARLFDELKPDYITSFIMDYETGEIVASCNYPYYDLNLDHNPSENRTYLSSIVIDNRLYNPFFISKITDYKGNLIINGKDIDYKKSGFTTDFPSTVSIISNLNNYSLDDSSAILIKIPKSEPKYYIFIGVVKPSEKNENNYVLINTVTEIEAGLRAQTNI